MNIGILYPSKTNEYRDISSSGWDIFLEFLENFLRCWYIGYKEFRMFIFVGSLLQLEKLRYFQLWMRYLFEFLWTHSWDVGTFVPHNFEFLTYFKYLRTSWIQLVGHLLTPLVLLWYIFTFSIEKTTILWWQ